MKFRVKSPIILLVSLILGACASTQLTPQQLNEQFPTVVQLEKELDQAKSNDIQLLAPELYQSAFKEYLDAYMAANSGQTQVAKSGAQAGLNQLNKANSVAATSRQVLSEVLDARKRAKEAGAEEYYMKEMEDNDKDLVDITKLIEDNKIDKAKKQRTELQHAYTNLELKSLQKSTIADAQNAINKAKANDAEKLAPKTLAIALEELTTAKSVLAVDRTNRAKANSHATRSTIYANRSNQIAAAIKEFKQRKFTEEDIILTFQNDLGRLGKTIAKDLQFDKPNAATVTELENDLNTVVATNATQKTRIQELEGNISQMAKVHANEITALEARYSGEISVLGQSQEELERKQREQQARFERIQNMFNDREANVFRQKNNVLISVHGFKFPTGSSEIRPDNYPLMNNIVKAIDEFQGSNIVVSGHTDATGTAFINKDLSEKRAQSVSKFFVDIGGIAQSRIQTQGFGQERPVADNQSAEGRAKNRRVEILIVNE